MALSRSLSLRSALSPKHSKLHIIPSVTPNPLPAAFLRGGTSKGIFLKRSDLPADRSEWDQIFLGIMGSPDPIHGRQLNGMGGGISSLSKICVVGSPTPDQKKNGIQVEYTFVQVGIRDSSIDYSGNCGNLSSVIGVFAVDEGICKPKPVNGTHATVRSLNTNTQKIIDTTFPISNAKMPVLDMPQASVAGVPGEASRIILEFINPSGARTGKLLPTGAPIESLVLPSTHGHPERPISISCVDATNPTVFVSADDLRDLLPLDEYLASPSSNVPEITIINQVLELIRQVGAGRMNLDTSAQAQPKIAIVGHPSPEDHDADIVVHALSMGVLHKAVPMTVGLCLGVAAGIQDTLAWEIVKRSRARGGVDRKRREEEGLVRIKHPSGIVDVGAEVATDGSVKSARVIRTGRRLMKGVVWW